MISFSDSSDPSEESQRPAGLNMDPFFFALEMCIYLINWTKKLKVNQKCPNRTWNLFKKKKKQQQQPTKPQY